MSDLSCYRHKYSTALLNTIQNPLPPLASGITSFEDNLSSLHPERPGVLKKVSLWSVFASKFSLCMVTFYFLFSFRLSMLCTWIVLTKFKSFQ